MGLATALSLAIPVLIGLALHLFTDAIPRLSKIAVARAARRLPEAVKRDHGAAWIADLVTLETDFERLRCVAACWLTSLAIRYPFALEESHRNLLSARQELRLQGAVVYYAAKRIKAWNLPDDPKNWTYVERWTFGVIIASGRTLPPAMKKYLLCLEEDVKSRPRIYASQEDAAKDLIMPIYREIAIWKYLKEHRFLIVDGIVVEDQFCDRI